MKKVLATGFGFKVGYQGQFGKMIRFGASYQSKMNMSEFDRVQRIICRTR